MISAVIAALVLPQEQLVDRISADRLVATVEKLASFETRNTNSDGLTRACEWAAAELRKIPRLQVELMTYPVKAGRRIAEDREVVQVVAVLPGRTDRRILIGGHIDSLNLRVDPKTGRAPGANDDASGVAVTMELARVFAQREWENTIVFVAFSGEEQGLFGSTALAKRASEEGWKLEAVFNNDTVGSSSNLAGYRDDRHVRVFSETGDDHQSRELARFIEWQVRQELDDFGVKLVFRRDRFGRGGDHTPFVREGFNAVRFIEVHEEYTRQHTPDDLPEFIDQDYIRNAARANFVAMAAIANSKPSPQNVRIRRDQGHDTTLHWEGIPGTKYVVYWRDTASPIWQGVYRAGEVSEFKVMGINKDDHTFAVGSDGGIPVEAH